MKATLLDLRRNPGKIVEAIERNETVTLSKRGREIALIIPKGKEARRVSIKQDPAFGLWKDRADLGDPAAFVRDMRKSRFGDL